MSENLAVLARLAETSAPMATDLYRHFDGADQLLYVGITERWYFKTRQREHGRRARWWQFVDRVDREHHSDPAAASSAERAAIAAEQPVFNKAWNGVVEQQRGREATYLHRRGWTWPKIAHEFGVDQSTAHRWAQPYLKDGEE